MPVNPASEPTAAGDGGLLTELYRGIFEHSPEALFLFDDQRRFTDANPAACLLAGRSREEIVGAVITQYLRYPSSVDAAELDTRWRQFLRDGYRVTEGLVARPDGTERYIEMSARLNILPGVHLCAAHDITARKFAEEGVRCAEEFYRTLIETTNTGYVVADAAGSVLEANEEYVRLAGAASINDLRGRHPREWTVPEDRGRLAAGFETCWRQGFVRNLEVDFVDPSGRRLPVEISASLLGEGDDRRVLALCRDITGRLQTQQELHSARVELEHLVQNRTAELGTATAQLQARARQQESVAELGRRALAGEPIQEVMDRAVRTVADVLDLEYCAVLEQPDLERDELVLRATVGWPTYTLGEVIATTDPAFATGYALHHPGPVTFENIDAETRFQATPGMHDAGVLSGATASIRDEHTVFGLLAARCLRRRPFTADDAHFLQSVANVLAAAIARRRAEETIHQAQLGAVQANNAKIDFLSRMSHELRTPLNAILGFSQLLEIERLNDGQRESVEQITRAGRHLLELVNEVLDMSRIDSGNFALVPEPLFVQELWSEAVDLIRPLADKRAVAVTVEPADGHHVLADRQRLRQVLLNLLSNAVKYNREAGSVTLHTAIAPDDRHLRLSVTDAGGGIAPEHLPLLFTPFERLGAENTEVEGSGIGLALARRLVEAMGGTVGVESEVGVGSTFWIDLPVAAAPLDTDSASGLLDELIHARLFEDDEPAELSAPPSPSGKDARQRLVLHIEDNEPNQRLIEMLLSQRPSLRLLTASRGGEGLELAQKYHPDLILLDVHLPDTSGEDVLQDLRAGEGTRDVPVVIVSADAASIKHHQLHAIGANNYLLKPFNVRQFLEILDEYLVRDAA